MTLAQDDEKIIASSDRRETGQFVDLSSTKQVMFSLSCAVRV